MIRSNKGIYTVNVRVSVAVFFNFIEAVLA